jgi:hypothetical protein
LYTPDNAGASLDVLTAVPTTESTDRSAGGNDLRNAHFVEIAARHDGRFRQSMVV